MDNREQLVAFADSLLNAATEHASADQATIQMPGPSGPRGSRVDGLEGFARTFLLASFRIAGSSLEDPQAKRLAHWYSKGIKAGVDPHNPGRWIRPEQASQARVEAASIALGLDMTRDQIWNQLDPATQACTIDYLASVVDDDNYPPNNWLWFRIVTETFLRSVGGPWSLRDVRFDLDRYQSFFRGDGWFTDGIGRRFDHYAGWAMHLYPTMWSRMHGADELIEQVAPDFTQSSSNKLTRFLEDAVQLVGAGGSPLIQGRSLIYRFAAAAPFWVGGFAEVPSPPLGQLRRAALKMVSHFTSSGVPDESGLLNLGWHEAWPAMAQTYSGPSSPYWASKGLLGIALKSDHPMWLEPDVPLTVEESDFVSVISAPGWLVSGTESDGIVRVINHGTDNAVLGSNDTDSPLYARFGYSTETAPLLRDVDYKTPSDQSVSLLTKDGTGSHRTGMLYLGSTRDNVASSLNALHWVRPYATEDNFGGGLQGDSEFAGQVVVHSIVRGSTEVRIIRVLSSDDKASRLRCSGWPVSGGNLSEKTNKNTATVTNELDLESSLEVSGQNHEDQRVPLGVVTAEHSTFLGPVTSYPYVDLPSQAGLLHVLVLGLTGKSTSSGTDEPNVSVDAQPSSAGTLTVAITWQDGMQETYVINTLAEKLSLATENALEIIASSMEKFRDTYPDDSTRNLRYPVRFDESGRYPGSNLGWTTGFWVGTCEMAYELSNDPEFLRDLDSHYRSFLERLNDRIDIDHHDMGFLYSLSGTLPYYLTGDRKFRDMALMGADVLMERYLEKAGIIQAWGDINDPTQSGRAIIDSLMNMPLLYWASRETGNPKYAEAARRHSTRLLENIIREDNTTHHTYYFDPETGEALFGNTAQGVADDSTWARGQAWGIYGFALSYAETKDPAMLDGSIRCANRFLELLPEDSVPFWDMVFSDGDEEPRDSSSGAIAVCGMIELAQSLRELNRNAESERYFQAALRIMESLIDNYSTSPGSADALLDHSVYSKPDDRGVDEGSVWGDYFYMEALARLTDPEWTNPWMPPTEAKTLPAD